MNQQKKNYPNLPDDNNNYDQIELICCEDCGSLDIEIDLETYKIICKKCKKKQDGKRKTFESINEKEIDSMRNEIEKAIKRGDRFF